MRPINLGVIAVVAASLIAYVLLPLRAGAHEIHNYHPADYPYPHVHSLVRDPADPQHIYALGNPDAYESYDGGLTWHVRGSGVPTAHYARLLFEPNSGHLFAYTPGVAGFHRSTDTGWTWPKQTDLPLRDVVVRDQAGAVELLAIAHDLRFVVSDDGGVTWNERSVPWGAAGDARLVQLPGSGAALLVVANSATYRSNDGGRTWERVGNWPAELTPVRLFASADTDELYAVAHHGQFDPRPVGNTLLRSVDGGRSWETAGVAGLWAVVSARGSVVVAATWRGDVWRYAGGAWSDAGSWSPWPLALVQPLQLRQDVNPTPTVTDLLLGVQGELVVSTVLGMYRAERWGLPLMLRSRGLVPTAALPTAPVDRPVQHTGTHYFAQTGHVLDEPFLSAWERLGGLKTLGYPLTEHYLERDVETGQDRLVQLFERGRLEQNESGLVTAARIVAEVESIAARVEPQPNCQYSSATGHNVCGEILRTWHALGGERWLGLPLGEAQLRADVRVQLFERGRLEQRTAGRAWAVVPGLVGREEAQRRGWLP